MAKPTLKRAAFLISIVATYGGLAILGRGGVEAFFREPALAALIVLLLTFGGVALFAGGNLSPGLCEDRANRWVFVVFGIVGLLNGYLPAYADRTNLWTFEGETVRWIGLALASVGATLRIWPVFVLGDRFSGLVAIQPGHKLVTTGVYGVVRHPSYLGMLTGMLGWTLAFRTWMGVLLALLMLPALLARIEAEETMLQNQFPGEYEAYCARTRRLVPGVY